MLRVAEPGNARLSVFHPDTGVPDVDLSITPATNTLPIRRMALDINESASVGAAWVRLPDLVVQRLSQRYVRMGRRSYRYVSEGVVVRYRDIWERFAPRSVTSR